MLVRSISGIRGIYGKDLTSNVIRRYAVAFYQFLNKKLTKIKLIIGTDSRPSGFDIKKEFVQILSSHNTEIIDVGINTTPAIQLAVREYKADGGIIITASHNPAEYNGIKFLNNHGSLVGKKDFDKIIENYHHTDLPSKIKPNFNNIINRENDLRRKYIKFLCEFIGKDNLALIKNIHSKIILDPNGGSACIILKELFAQIGLPIIIINNTPGEFKREIEPNEKSLVYLIDLLNKQKADFAAGFDCDADRVGIIMNNGKILSGNYILALTFDEILSQATCPEKQTIVVNNATSYVVKDIVEKYDAQYKEVEVGEINVVHKMYRLGAIAGGEGSSGGGIFPPSTCRDGILTLLIILKSIARKQKSLLQLFKELPVYYTLQDKIKCNQQLNIKKRLRDYFLSKHYHINEDSNDTHSLKIFITDHSWVWYRMSKTEPETLRIVIDSKNEQEAKNFKQKLYKETSKIINR